MVVQNAKIATLLRKHVLRFKINLSDPTMRKRLTLRLLDCSTNLRKHRARVPAKIFQVLTDNSLHANRCYCLKKHTET